eukprot:scaffold249_cov262-Chaetoceros_neogracile.AAC.18
MKKNQLTIVLNSSLISSIATIAQGQTVSNALYSYASPAAFHSFPHLHPSQSTSQSIHRSTAAFPIIAKFSFATELQLQTNFQSQSQHLHQFSMPRGIKKENLPTKTCITCERPFTWRKKWEKCWDEVTACSKSCNRKRRQHNSSSRLMMKQQHQHGGDDEWEDTDVASVVTGIAGIDIEEKDEGLKDDESEEQGTDQSDKKKVPLPSTYDDDYTNDRDGILFDDGEQLLKELNLLSNNGHATDSNLASEDEEESSLSQSLPSSKLPVDPNEIQDPIARKKELRKAEKKRKKQERRAKREGRGDKSVGQKQCDMCSKSVDLLIRCTYDESLDWKMICGKCWNIASGGVVDGDKDHPYYRYGGLWKNRKRK